MTGYGFMPLFVLGAVCALYGLWMILLSITLLAVVRMKARRHRALQPRGRQRGQSGGGRESNGWIR